jgi:MoxR-like ATPase
MKHYYLTRTKELVECEIINETPFKREIKLLEGPDKDQVKTVHPKGVSWGGMYPRIFSHTKEDKPTPPFIFRGRAIMSLDCETKNLIPNLELNYRFQAGLAHIIDSINSHENILLTGPTGSGKTSQVLQLAARIGQGVVRANFNGETRLSDFLGKMHVIGGETKWVDGILPIAMRHGYWLLLDEIDAADPSVLSLLHPVLEENPVLVLKENDGEVIKPHHNFRVFGTANSIGAMQDRSGSYSGTNQMNEAFLDRWQVILVPNMSAKEELKVIKNKVGGLKTRWAKRIVEFAQKVRDKKLEGFEFSSDSFSTRRVISWAKKTALLGSPIAGARLAWLDKMPESEQGIVVKILETHFGTQKTSRRLGTKKGTELGFKPTVAKRGRGRPKKVVPPATGTGVV